MKNNIHYFSKSEHIKNEYALEKIGLRGKQANDFSMLNLPILPGFIIDSDIASHIDDDVSTHLRPYFKKLATQTGKTFGDTENPMVLKLVISPNLAIANYPTLHNFGLTDETIEGFNTFVGENFGLHEIEFLLKGMLDVEQRIAEFEKREKDSQKLKNDLDKLNKEIDKDQSASARRKAIDTYKAYLPENFFTDAYTQLDISLKRISRLLYLDDMVDDDAAILVQPMVYGNFGKDSASGFFYTRDIVTGEKELQGSYFENEFDTYGLEGNDINKISKKFHTELEKIAKTVEDHFKEIRQIRFTIENGNVWLVDQRPIMTKSTQSDIQTLLDLHDRKIIDDTYLINAIKPSQLHEILHPVVDLGSVKSFKTIEGGIAGAPGAAIGRIFFSTDGLLEARKTALLHGEELKFILCMPATYAEDVKAIEVATGVLSNEGGYSAHASVVARQYGKVSLVKTDMKIRGKKAEINGITIKEGDIITLNVPQYGDPQIFLGKANLIEPDPEKSGLLEFGAIVKKHIKDFHVRVNADTPRDASLALKFGAEGIGLCRTEHMFFDEKRINVFREMIISDTVEKRNKVLTKLKNMQKTDFYKLLKIMEGKEVTIRLLDAPLHEFLPHNEEELKGFVSYLKKQKAYAKVTKTDINAVIESLAEINPMLGHRGCRIAVSYPEIYEMQVQAIFEALYTLKKEGIDAKAEIMIPLIMNDNELKLIIYGKKIEGKHYKGILAVEKEVREKSKAKNIDFKIGTMIELPVAALGAGEIAKFAEFFSFGTNDLTQTTIGLSRDDFNSFMPDYTQFDILDGNPFQLLDTHVKELISTAVRRGVMTRPDLKKGLCGEHGAIPENIKFCKWAGLDYVSCSTYSVPIANLAVAQMELESKKQES
jgi:pyruvate, orthophosphate dikinase